MLEARPDWFGLAACHNRDPALFFPPNAGGVIAAQAVCAFCPVAVECEAYAMENGEDHGVWGGLDPGSLRSARRLPGAGIRTVPLEHGTIEGYDQCRRRPEGSCRGCRDAMRVSA